MKLLFFVSILLASLAVIFALQNAQPVKVAFLSWYFEGSLVIVLLLTFVAGILSAYITAIPGYVRLKRELSALRRKDGRQNGGAQKEA